LITRTQDLSWPNKWLNEEQISQLKAVIADCFSGISSNDYYLKYFANEVMFKRDLRLFYANSQIVGYCLFAYQKSANAVLARASAGFYPDYRHGSNTLVFTMKQSIKYWLCHPWQRIYFADTMLSPAMYRAIAKRAGITYPSVDYPVQHSELFSEFNQGGEISSLTNTQCLVDTGRKTQYSKNEVASLQASTKPEIAFYCKVNLEFTEGKALFVIMPISLKQLFKTILKVFKRPA
jgi:hypothetical protein